MSASSDQLVPDEARPATPARRCRRGLVALLRDTRAVAAVEFALLLPLMLVLYIAGNEVGQSIAIYRKVAQTSYTMGDLVTQVSTVAVTDVLAASSAVMSPYSASGAQMVLSAVTYNGSKFTVRWSKASGSGAVAWTAGSAPPSTVTIPTNLVSGATSANPQDVIVAQVKYTYTTAFTSVMQNIWGGSTITLSDIVFLRPRLSTTILCSDC